MKKKRLLCLFALVFLFSITGCGSDKPATNDDVKDVKEVKTLPKANIEETVILDKDGIKITAKSINYDGWAGPEIKVLIENNSSENVTIQTRRFSINGIMIDPTFSVDISAGKKANDAISISTSDL